MPSRTAGPRRRPSSQGGEEGEAGALEAGAVGDAGVERAARALDGEVAVGGAVVAEEAGAVDAGGGEAGGELVAGAVTADGGEEGDRAAEGGERARHVLRHAAGLARDAAGDVGAGGQRRGGARDDVPVRGPDAEERRAGGAQFGEKRSLM